jgi:HEAT repeat protein
MRFWPIALLIVGCSDAPNPDLNSTNPHARFLGALEKADRSQDADTIKTLVDMAGKDPDPLARSGAITALGVIGRPGIAQHLIPIAVNAKEERMVRTDAIITLAKLKDPQALPALLDLLKGEPDMSLRREAAKALPAFGKKPEILAALLEALDAKDPSVAYRAHLSLTELTGLKDVARTRAAWDEALKKNP